jgi:hypothetical protein
MKSMNRVLVASFGLIFSMTVAAAPTPVAYDFSFSPFGEGIFNETPAPLEGVSGSFGFTFEASSAPTIYEVDPDFVSLSILGTDYPVGNTSVQINDGDRIVITFGDPLNNTNSASEGTDDFYLYFQISDTGEPFTDRLGVMVVCRQATASTATDCWQASANNDSIVLRSVEPDALLAQLDTALVDLGPGTSFGNKISIALAYYQAGDIQSACEMLSAFQSQVAAQRGKKLTAAQADQFDADAAAIIEAIGCD